MISSMAASSRFLLDSLNMSNSLVLMCSLFSKMPMKYRIGERVEGRETKSIWKMSDLENIIGKVQRTSHIQIIRLYLVETKFLFFLAFLLLSLIPFMFLSICFLNL